MRLISYDCEVFAYDWLVTLKDKETGVYTCIWNDNEALKMALSDDCIYVGFNSKHYDQYIIKAIAAGFAPEEIKKVNDFIIAGGQGWQCPLLDGIYFRFSNVDIRDDTQQGLSLKAIEGHLGMSVKESSVPFDIDRPLTPEEKAETEFYCKHDGYVQCDSNVQSGTTADVVWLFELDDDSTVSVELSGGEKVEIPLTEE